MRFATWRYDRFPCTPSKDPSLCHGHRLVVEQPLYCSLIRKLDFTSRQVSIRTTCESPVRNNITICKRSMRGLVRLDPMVSSLRSCWYLQYHQVRRFYWGADDGSGGVGVWSEKAPASDLAIKSAAGKIGCLLPDQPVLGCSYLENRDLLIPSPPP